MEPTHFVPHLEGAHDFICFQLTARLQGRTSTSAPAVLGSWDQVSQVWGSLPATLIHDKWL